MGLLNLITSLGTKTNETYSRFLDAWSRLQQMKDVDGGLGTLTECILSENDLGHTKCLEYARTHGIDKAILQLHASVDIEPFFIALFKSSSASYLNGEISHLVWRYGNFPGLVLLMCELYVVNNIYNSSLARHICDILPSAEPRVFSGLVLLVPLETYGAVFADMGLGQKVVACSSNLLSQLSSASFPTIDFLCFYEDISKEHLIEQLDFTAVKKPGFEEIAGASPRPYVTYSDRLLFYTDLFREIKTKKFRLLLIAHSVNFIEERGFPNFLSSCISADPSLLAAIFSNTKGQIDWSPLKISKIMMNILTNGGSKQGALLGNALLTGGGISALPPSLFHPVGAASEMADNNFNNTNNTTVRFNISDPLYFVNLTAPEKYYSSSCTILKSLIKNGFSDIRPYLFLYSVNKPLFYHYFDEIIKICEDKFLLVKIIHEKIACETH